MWWRGAGEGEPGEEGAGLYSPARSSPASPSLGSPSHYMSLSDVFGFIVILTTQSRNLSTSPIPTTECISYGDAHPVTDVAHCPCSHYYCRGCLASLFQASMLDEALFPPRCCREPILLDPNRKFLTAELAGQFQAKKVEFETKDRMYCHRNLQGRLARRRLSHCDRHHPRSGQLKTCRYEQWNEDRLYAHAAAIVNHDAGAPGLGARRHERLVQQEMQNQRRNHACEDHD
ncbi:hypothetical protein C7999DRAFT_36445 [Corynascus novoguineensis]|uniref:RING-type domain-containing protein n=1 Tax=Corynascus novoguineensis TaxID=1126955 RepID=A0AAN7CKC2_9PEZI|nr:hypothetical protein C7999DRAFT_36445 [Corynascus novoguineensis]